MFKVALSSHTQKFLKKSDKQLYQRLIKKIKDLRNDPFPSDSKRIVGKKEKVFRIRVGDYRIEYVVYYEVNEILIADVDKRDKIHNK